MKHPLEATERSTLTRARERARRMRAAGGRLGESFTEIRQWLTLISMIVPGVPIAMFVSMWVSSPTRDPAPYAIGAIAVTALMVNLSLRIFQRLGWNRYCPELGFQRVLDKCLEVPDFPSPIDQALDQVLEAYFALRKLGEEPDWKRVGYPMDQHLTKASERVIELLEWGRRLAIIGDRLERSRGRTRETPEFRETESQYVAQCAQIAAAAAAFSRAEAKVTLAYAALSASTARDTVAAGQLQELTAVFDALTEVLTEAEVRSPIVPPAEEAHVLAQRT